MPNLALQLTQPNFDAASDLRSGQAVVAGQQDLAAGGMKNQLSALNLQEETGKQTALNDYRAAAKAGDKNAISKLAGYPEVQAQIHDALAKMKPDQALAATNKANAFGTAAMYVSSFAPGSPERAAAWTKAVDDLAKNGHIDKSQAEYWKKTGPSDVLIQQAMTVKDAVASYNKVQDTADLTPKDLLDIETKVGDFNQHFFPSGTIGVTPEQIKARDQAVQDYKNTLVTQIREAKAKTTKATPNVLGGPNVAATPAPKGNVLDLTPKGAGATPAPGSSVPTQPVLGAPAPAAPTAKTQNYDIYSAKPVALQGGQPKAPQEAPPATLKEWKPGKPAPATHTSAVKITGTPDEQRAQLQKLPPGTPVILPDGTPTYRK